tara:strand:- start:41 stop:487 length:447 start_codon:yes stop_codon:yes gene_type:complete
MQHSKRYIELKDFIQNRMRMSHVYQPVMLSALLTQNGTATSSEIASALLSKDQSQIEYYQQIVNGMVGKVLRSHQLVTKLPRQSDYYLEGYSELNAEEVQQRFVDAMRNLENYYLQEGAGKNSTTLSEFFSTHPETSERIKLVEEFKK